MNKARLLLQLIAALLILVEVSFSQTIPQNAHKNPYGAGWDCDRGFQKSNSGCTKIDIPYNASLDFLGHKWECNRGFQRVGSGCTKVDVPANASLDYLGHNWECNSGFKRVASECKAMTEAEHKLQAEQEQAILQQLKRRRSASVSGHHCDTEYTSGANVCVTVRDADLDCSESYTRGHYDSCRVEVSFNVKTDYRGGGSIDAGVHCEVTLATTGASGYESSSSEDENSSFSLYANGSTSRSVEMDFSFSSYEGVRKARVDDISCRVRNLYVH